MISGPSEIVIESSKRLTGVGEIYLDFNGSLLAPCPAPIRIATKTQTKTTRATVIVIDCSPPVAIVWKVKMATSWPMFRSLMWF